MSNFWQGMILSAVRHSLSGAAFWAVGHGFTDQAGADQIIAGACTLVLVFWKWFDESGRAQLSTDFAALLRNVPRRAPMVAALALLLFGADARAGSLTLKAPLAPVPACSLTLCTGWLVGANLGNDGSNLNVISTGLSGVASTGLFIGGDGGYEFYNGQWYFSARGFVDYDYSQKAGPVAPSDKLAYGAYVSVGYSLATLFGAATTGTPVTLPQQLMSALMTPTVHVGTCRRHSQECLLSGAGVEALLATNWTLNADYFNFNYGANGSAGNGLKRASENEFLASINYHFGSH